MNDLRLLLDGNAIAELLTRYLRAVDPGDVATRRASHPDGATEEHGGLCSGPAQGYVDTIEAALTSSGLVEAAGGWRAAPDAGYRVAYALARDLLSAGHHVVADSVNPLTVTRLAWAGVASDTGSGRVDVEVVCSDRTAHRRRVEARTSDLDGLRVPTWEEVESRHYEPWDPPVVTVDTANGIDDAVAIVVSLVQAASQRLP